MLHILYMLCLYTKMILADIKEKQNDTSDAKTKYIQRERKRIAKVI